MVALGLVTSQTHLVAIGLWRGDVILDGARDGCPLSVDKAHDVVTKLGACAVQGGILVLVQVNDDLQLCHIHYLFDVLLAHCANFVNQLPTGLNDWF